MQTDAALPLTRDLVLVGGGHAHALLLRAWGMQPLAGARLTLISPEPTAPYTGMLPGHIAGHYPRDALEIDLVRLARHAGARLILGRAEGIDRQARRIHVPGRPPVAYDVASLDIGITASMPLLPGFADHAVPVKPMADFAARWAAFLAAPPPPGAPVVVIGAGAAGAEVAMAMAWRLRRALPQAGPVTLIEAGNEPLREIGARARARVLAAMERLGIRLLTGTAAARIEADAVVLADGRRIASAFTLGAAGPQPQAWLAATGLDLTGGFVTVDRYLRSVSDPAIFAVGDCAHMRDSPRPRAGVFAVRQAPVLRHNLRAALGAGTPQPYRPQRDYLRLIATGEQAAVADKHGFSLSGPWLWRMKDRIDRRFMARLAELPPPAAPALPELAAEGLAETLSGRGPLCGGCGAKLGALTLAGALAALPASSADLEAGPGDDAAILRLPGGARQVLTTDTLRAFCDDPVLMARVTALHALGDIWAMGARPQAALLGVVLPQMSESLQSRTLSEIMATLAETLGAEGVEIAGGHSALGAEPSLTVTLTGLFDAGRQPLRKGGARPGDWLILTRPVGTGVILAAEMQRAAPGPVVAAAWAQMARSQGQAAAILARHARAMTDVTGFGLAGHLLEMLDAGGCAARLDAAAVPALPGAAALAAAGHASVLAPANRAAVEARADLDTGAGSALLVDPQTAGGLLAAVPQDHAATLLAALHAAGFADAAAIGSVEDGPAQIRGAAGAVRV